MKSILIVDDEDIVRSALTLLLKQQFKVEEAENGIEALEKIKLHPPDIILLDVMMPKLDGIETLKELQIQSPQIPVIMLTGSNTVRTAVEAMKIGARDYLNKPFDVEELTNLIVKMLNETEEGQRNQERDRKQKRDAADKGVDFIGESTEVTELLSIVDQVAKRDSTILVTGESGVGKELIAKRVHSMSLRKDKPFIAINCAAIPESLIESELFGHEKGAFTNADQQRIGFFQQADSGTLFLDEIGELALNVQVKLLRFLQEQEFMRIGGDELITVDVRIVAATNKSLEEMVKEKRFREDLYYRINVVNLEIPSLKERSEDIPLLIEYFSTKFASEYKRKKLELTPKALKALVHYEWPGNVRELENSLESIYALATSDTITYEMLPERFKGDGDLSEPPLREENVLTQHDTMESAELHFEKEIILKALNKTNFDIEKAATMLGIATQKIEAVIEQYGFKPKA